MKKLTVPATLSVAVVLSAGCGSSSVPASDARADLGMDAVADVIIPDIPTDHACLEAEVFPLGGGPGLECTPTAAMAGRIHCRTDRVCDSAECGPGCEGCEEALFCIPMAAGATCLTQRSCSENGCGPGCQALG